MRLLSEIVSLYSRYEESPIAKIFPTRAFGYRRLTIERPLKLAFYPQDAERLANLTADKGWTKLDGSLQSAILTALGQFAEAKLLSRDKFKKQLTKLLGEVKLPGPGL